MDKREIRELLLDRLYAVNNEYPNHNIEALAAIGEATRALLELEKNYDE